MKRPSCPSSSTLAAGSCEKRSCSWKAESPAAGCPAAGWPVTSARYWDSRAALHCSFHIPSAAVRRSESAVVALTVARSAFIVFHDANSLASQCSWRRRSCTYPIGLGN
eukprot:5616615-Pyramimonas_sp.AAC.2